MTFLVIKYWFLWLYNLNMHILCIDNMLLTNLCELEAGMNIIGDSLDSDSLIESKGWETWRAVVKLHGFGGTAGSSKAEPERGWVQCWHRADRTELVHRYEQTSRRAGASRAALGRLALVHTYRCRRRQGRRGSGRDYFAALVIYYGRIDRFENHVRVEFEPFALAGTLSARTSRRLMIMLIFAASSISTTDASTTSSIAIATRRRYRRWRRTWRGSSRRWGGGWWRRRWGRRRRLLLDVMFTAHVMVVVVMVIMIVMLVVWYRWWWVVVDVHFGPLISTLLPFDLSSFIRWCHYYVPLNGFLFFLYFISTHWRLLLSLGQYFRFYCYFCCWCFKAI